jgi:NADPH:quinone reductase-like Zn-dependent oxidoreductase
MKAYHLHGHAGAGGLVRADVGKPEPANGEVRIRVEAAGLNYRDLLILDRARQGGLDGRVPLSDGAGVVDAVAPDVVQWRVGDRVAASFFRDWVSGPFKARYMPSALGGSTMDGMLAEYVVLPASALVSVPEHLSLVEAATLPCAGVTVWHGLIVRGGMGKGDTLLVQGQAALRCSAFSSQRHWGRVRLCYPRRMKNLPVPRRCAARSSSITVTSLTGMSP